MAAIETQISILQIEGTPEPQILRGILSLYHTVFGYEKTEKVEKRYATMPQLHTVLALYDNQIVGFKTGYALDERIFYSWLGCVDNQFRGQGIAVKLMNMQYEWCKNKGYLTIQTKTMNRWREMLILNLKTGFEIVETYRDEQGVLKIILEKKV
jgi:predicted GNAT superfamily acetyltransferase